MKQKLLIIAGVIVVAFASCKEKPAKPSPSSNAVDTVAVFVLHDTTVTKIIELPAELLPQ